MDRYIDIYFFQQTNGPFVKELQIKLDFEVKQMNKYPCFGRQPVMYSEITLITKEISFSSFNLDNTIISCGFWLKSIRIRFMKCKIFRTVIFQLKFFSVNFALK